MLGHAPADYWVLPTFFPELSLTDDCDPLCGSGAAVVNVDIVASSGSSTSSAEAVGGHMFLQFFSSLHYVKKNQPEVSVRPAEATSCEKKNKEFYVLHACDRQTDL